MFKTESANHNPRLSPGASDPRWLRIILIVVAITFLSMNLVLPLAVIVYEALKDGVRVYWQSLINPAAISSIQLTLFTAAIAVPLNIVFGLAASWSVAKFDFRGKALVTTLIDVPLSISPVLSGMLFVLLFGLHGWFGPWLIRHDIQIIFAVPGIVLVTLFVTFPYVARELIPLMQQLGSEEEQAAISLGASGWQTFWRVTMPNIKWGLLYGTIICNARAMGEFGAVSVVSGHIRGKTNTVPLHVEVLYNDYNATAAFAVASLLAVLGILTLILKTFVEKRMAAESPAPEA